MDLERVRKYYGHIKNALLGPRNKEFLIFLLFFFISAAFWLLQSLNETFDVEIQVPLKLENVPSDVVVTSELPSLLAVKVRDKGTVLVRYIYGAEQLPVDVDYKDFDKGMTSGGVVVPLPYVQKKIQSRLLSSTSVVSIRPDTLEYFFNRGARKKVPVRMAGTIETSPEYYLKSVEFTPDSVEALAPLSILDTLSVAYVVPVHASGLSSNRRVTRSLHRLRGVKFIPAEVSMGVEVDLYTEKTVEVPVVGLNFPGSKDLRTFPSKVDVTFRVGMSRFKEITADDFVLAVTYEELMENDSVKLKLRLKSVPPGVSNVRIEPSEVDYLIEQTQGE